MLSMYVCQRKKNWFAVYREIYENIKKQVKFQTKKNLFFFAVEALSHVRFQISIWIEFKENSTTNPLCIYCPYNSTTIRVTCVRNNVFIQGFCGTACFGK